MKIVNLPTIFTLFNILLFTSTLFCQPEQEPTISVNESGLQLDSTLMVHWKKKGNAFYDTTRYDSALYYYDAYLKDIKPLLTATSSKEAWREYLKVNFKKSNCLRFLRRPEEEIALLNELDTLINNYLEVSDTLLDGVYSNLGRHYLLKKEYEQSINFYKKALTVSEKGFPKNDHRIAKNLGYIGANYENLIDYEVAMEFYTRAINILKENPIISKFSGGIYNNFGNFQRELGNHEKALSLIEIALKHHKKEFGENAFPLVPPYVNAGLIYDNLDQHRNAILYYEKALNVLRNLNDDRYKAIIGGVTNNKGIVARNLGEYEESLTYHQDALAIRKALFGKEDSEVATSYNEIGKVYFQKEDYETAKQYFSIAKNMRLKLLGRSNTLTADSYSDFGKLYQKLGQYDLALVNFKESLAIDRALFGDIHSYVSTTYANIGDVYGDKENYEIALSYYKKALEAGSSTFKGKDIFSNPQLSDKFKHLRKVPNLLAKKAFWLEALFTQNGQDLNLLKAANVTFLSAINFSRQVRLSFDRAADKTEQLKNTLAAFEGFIRTSVELHKRTKEDKYLTDAFQAQERSRNLLLLENFQSQNIEIKDNDLALILEQKRQNKLLLTNYESFLFEAMQNEKPDSLKIGQLQDKIFTCVAFNDSLNNILKNQYPSYYQLKLNVEVVDVEAIQKHLLSDSSALLEYFVGDSIIYVFTISKEDYQIHQIKKDFPLTQWIQKLRRSLYSYHLSGSRSEKLYQAYGDTLVLTSNQLYDKLIAPISQKITLPKQLVIIPDGALGYLPFELLIQSLPTNTTLFGTHTYLLNQHQISYNYSATLWQEMSNKKLTQVEDNYLAFAPEFSSIQPIASRTIDEVRAGLGALKFNIPEVEAIQQQIGGQVFTGTEATKSNFIQQASKYKILHLSTHGKANDKVGDFAYLAFAPDKDTLDYEKLYNRELYNLNLNAEMVVLSACETGIGELQKGEGIISLARGFSYAGAKSIITTLWSVNDAKTKEIMTNFYTHLQTSKSKDAALRATKLDFIRQHTNRAHPFYWAGFISIGDMHPIYLSKRPNWILWSTLFVSLFLVGILVHCKLRKLNSSRSLRELD